MKSLGVALSVVLLSAVLMVEAQRFPGAGRFPGGGFSGGPDFPRPGGGPALFPRPGGGRRCGTEVCLFGQRCIYEQVNCIRAPCPPIPRCV
uniref:Putative conserved secreted protein n=1 Tax=Amblyomma tuberculatum TaxID=48802 RepID=A0A6M2E3S7_9ACAR